VENCKQVYKNEAILNNNLSYNLCNDTNFVINAHVFSCFAGKGSEKCPLFMEGGCILQKITLQNNIIYANI